MQPRHFVILWIITFGFWSAVAFQSTIYPLFMSAAGFMEGQIGFISGAAALGGLLGRPLLGWAVDRYGTRIFLIAGACFWVVTGPLAYWTVSPGYLLLYRLLQGFGGAMITAAALGYVNYTTPPARRGAVISWWDTSGSASNLVGPVSAAALVTVMGFLPAFIAATTMGVLSLIFAFFLPDARPASPSTSGFKMFVRASLLPGLFGLVVGYALGGVIVLSPLVAGMMGLGNVGLFMLAFSLGTLAIRPFTASLSDRRGRAWVIVPGLVLLALATLLMGLFSSPVTALVAPFIFGLGGGSALPGLMAWSVDNAVEAERGSAGNTFYALWEVGVFVGASIQGQLLQRMGLDSYFVLTGLIGLSLVGFFAIFNGRRRRKMRAETIS
jgi:MFS family permease